jgi:uncharacterized damage-inducible protein DinB
MDHLRKEFTAYLGGGSTHAPLSKAVKNFPERLMNQRPENIPFSAWALLEHIRITQHDMVEFIKNPDYEELDWPKDYWPAANKKATKALWNRTLKDYEKDLAVLTKIVKDPKTDLFTPIPHGNGQTIMKEILQVIDHTAYHTGELVLLRRTLGAWRAQ